MARGKTISMHEMIASGRNQHLITGTDQDDIVNIGSYMTANGRRATNRISLGDGNDSISLGGTSGGSMRGSGTNIIEGGYGSKSLNILSGMDARSGGTNIVQFDGQMGDKHKMYFGTMVSGTNGSNVIITGAGTDNIEFGKAFQALAWGSNSVRLGDGAKTLDFTNGIIAYSHGENEVSLGNGTHKIQLNSSLTSWEEGYNRITTQAGNTFLNMKADMSTTGGENEISLGYGFHTITLGNMYSSADGTNTIDTLGTARLTIRGSMNASGGENHIYTDDGNDIINIGGNLSTGGGYYSMNEIATGGGDDVITIGGNVSGKNVFDTGDGNDVIKVNGKIYGNASFIMGDGNDTIYLNDQVISAKIDAGDGYDVLSLSAKTAGQFGFHYQEWIANMNASGELANTGLEQIQINVGGKFNLGYYDISKFISTMNDYNHSHPGDHIDVSINVDQLGGYITLDNLFTSKDESSVGSLDMSGNSSNFLEITDSLASHGFDGNVLHINGDNADTVAVDFDWMDTGTSIDQNSGIEYNVFHNMNSNEDIWIQSNVNVMYG